MLNVCNVVLRVNCVCFCADRMAVFLGRYSTFQYSVSGSGCVSVSVSGRFHCGHPILRFSVRQTYLPVYTLL